MSQFGSKPTPIPGQLMELKSDGCGLAGAVEAIQKTAAEAAREHRAVEFMHPPLEPEHIYRVKHGETLSEIIEATPPSRRHRLSDLRAVVDFCQRHSTDKTIVWVGETSVVVVLDDDKRRDWATCNLRLDARFKRVCKLAKGGDDHDDEDSDEVEMMTQVDFLRLLRIELAGTHDSIPNLIPIFKQIKAASGNQSEGDVGHGAVAMSRAAQAKVTGADTLPEKVALDLPVYENAIGGNSAVKCAIEIDPSRPAFGLKPFAGEIAAAIYGTRKTIVDLLRGDLKRAEKEAVTVLLGSP